MSLFSIIHSLKFQLDKDAGRLVDILIVQWQRLRLQKKLESHCFKEMRFKANKQDENTQGMKGESKAI
jgi:hypothetical protein